MMRAVKGNEDVDLKEEGTSRFQPIWFPGWLDQVTSKEESIHWPENYYFM